VIVSGDQGLLKFLTRQMFGHEPEFDSIIVTCISRITVSFGSRHAKLIKKHSCFYSVFLVLFLGLYTQREAEGCERRSAKEAKEQAKRVQACELALHKPNLYYGGSLSCWKKEQPFRSGLISAPLTAHHRYLRPNGIFFVECHSNLCDVIQKATD
jgi:hypothetical protein